MTETELAEKTRSAVHDLNNLMCTILGFAELIYDSLPPDHPIHQDLAEIQRAGQRAVACTRELGQLGQLLPRAA